MYDLHRLRLLRELQLRGTLAAVAKALSYSPSSVSQQLSHLEAEVGVPLLEPVGRRVRLTPQAQILVRHVDAVLHQLELAESDVAASLTHLTGELRVATFQTAALALVPAALTAIRTAHPHLRMRYGTESLSWPCPPSPPATSTSCSPRNTQATRCPAGRVSSSLRCAPTPCDWPVTGQHPCRR